ncbi:hypothetical protein [Lysobacter sp. FW306-1B-D06B]|uniref:hypothetical protein n=1 Tax=Lysobacter sp. FW306-1B-D06B TaxID=3140250 RepID=UPI0031403335
MACGAWRGSLFTAWISMTADRTFLLPNSLILGAIGVTVIATAGLVAFSGNLLVWQVASWTLAAALLALLGLVLACGYSLATNRIARTWQRMSCFAAGLAILMVLVIGWF